MMRKPIKSIKKSGIKDISVYAVIVLCSFLIFNSVQAQPIKNARVSGKRGGQVSFQGTSDPFSLPALLRQFFEEEERKVQEELARSEKKTGKDRKSADGKTDIPAAEGQEPPQEEVLPELPSIAITGIIFSKDKPVAILNGEVLEAGEKLHLKEGPLLVRSIEKDQVIVDFQEFAFQVSMEGSSKRLGRADEQGQKNVF